MVDKENRKTFLRRYFLNKYLVVFVVFAVFVVFFDDHSIIHRLESRARIQNMEKELKFYQDEIEKTRRKKIELQSSDENLEKFAREQYLMKRSDEDIYIVNEDEKK